jgi:hypothetical protein
LVFVILLSISNYFEKRIFFICPARKGSMWLPKRATTSH